MNMEQLQKENDELNTLLKERETQLFELQAQVSLLSANVERLREWANCQALNTHDRWRKMFDVLQETPAQSLERSEKEGEASLRHIESRIAERQCEQLKAAVEEETIERCGAIAERGDTVEQVLRDIEDMPRKYKEQSDEEYQSDIQAAAGGMTQTPVEG